MFSVSHNRHWRSSLSSELIAVAHVLLELISVREGAFSASIFDDISVNPLMPAVANLPYGYSCKVSCAGPG